MGEAQVQGPGHGPGWYPDPQDPQAVRWWEGFEWTERVGTVHSADDSVLRDLGLYDYTTPGDGSLEYGEKLKEIRVRVKEMNRSLSALHFETEQYPAFADARAKMPKRSVDDVSKLLLSAFNIHAEAALKNLRYGNLIGSGDRINKAFTDVHKAGMPFGIWVSKDCFELRHEELQTVWWHLVAKKRERDEERDRRAALREENRVQLELAAEKDRLEKELEHYRKAFAALDAKGDDEGALRMLTLIEETERRIADVDYRAANIRAGYVYVISNIGTLGPDIVKIGMTRRLDPMDRVRELSNASVPFRYDVHALFFSTDAVSIETMLHHRFEDWRVNKVNRRREFFYVRPHQVLEALQEHRVELVEWIEEPEATEFRLGQGRDAPELAAEE
jgi:hypothetical protein